jgi:hypothetical protein
VKLRARAILEVLERSNVRYVVIGGIGARLWGSPQLTEDLDVCAAADRQNLSRLADALNELEAAYRVAGVGEGFPAPPWDARAFSAHLGASLTLVTKFGALDVWFRPDGTQGYRDLATRSREFPLEGITTRVAHIDDIIRSKQAAARERDLASLPLLQRLRRVLAQRDEL